MEIFAKKKKSHTFIAFDICDLHRSITEKLLGKALDFVSHYIEITTDERRVIKHTKRPPSITITCHGAK